MAKLSESDQKILAALDPQYRYNDWAVPVRGLAAYESVPRRLRALKKRGLVDGDGRGKCWAQFWITVFGKGDGG